jgi:hypothetical protein
MSKNAIQFTAVIFSDCGVYIQSYFEHIIDKLVALDGLFCCNRFKSECDFVNELRISFDLNLEVNILRDDQP